NRYGLRARRGANRRRPNRRCVRGAARTLSTHRDTRSWACRSLRLWPSSRRNALASAPFQLGDDGRDDLVQIADHGVVGLGDHGGIGIGVDREHVLRGLHTHPVLYGAGDPARDVELGGDALTGLADLIG